MGACDVADPFTAIGDQTSLLPSTSRKVATDRNAAPSRAAIRTPSRPNIAADGKDLLHRFAEPPGCRRVSVKDASYAAYLRKLALKPHGTKVRDYSGDVVHWGRELGAVVDMDLVGSKSGADLQQCADVGVRLFAEYHWKAKTADTVVMPLQNGQRISWRDWRRGTRGKVVGNRHRFTRDARADASYATFRGYLAYVMNWLGSAGVKRGAKKVAEGDVQAGDLYVQNSTGAIGHVSVILDRCESDSGSLYLVGEGYMPAQDTHVMLPSPGEGIGAWFTLEGLRKHHAGFGSGVFRRF